MDSLKFHPGLPCPTLLRPAGGLPPKWPYSHFWGGLPAVVFYPLGYPTSYGPGSCAPDRLSFGIDHIPLAWPR
jgi:hypothetical protein